MTRNLSIDKCKGRGNSGNVGFADLLSETDSRILHREGTESRRQKK